MQLGAGGEVSSAIPPLPCAVVHKPTTRMSPAGIPAAFTVTEPSRETDVATPIGLPWPDTAGAGGRGQLASIGTTTTRSSPSWRSFALASAIPDFW